jgi:hypothetical protein
MSVYLGFVIEEYRERGGITDAITGGRSLRKVRNRVESELRGYVRQRGPVEARVITVAEQIEARRNTITTSTLSPLRDIVVKARPAWVTTSTHGYVVRIHRSGFWQISWCGLVDDGDWSYHFEWTPFATYEETE